MSAATDTIVLDRDRFRAYLLQGLGRHRRPEGRSVSRSRRVLPARLLIVNLCAVAVTAMVGYGLVRVLQAINELRAANCQNQLNQQLLDNRAGVLAVCQSTTVRVRAPAAPAQPPGPARPATGKTPAMH